MSPGTRLFTLAAGIYTTVMLSLSEFDGITKTSGMLSKPTWNMECKAMTKRRKEFDFLIDRSHSTASPFKHILWSRQTRKEALWIYFFCYSFIHLHFQWLHKAISANALWISGHPRRKSLSTGVQNHLSMEQNFPNMSHLKSSPAVSGFYLIGTMGILSIIKNETAE